MGPWVSDPLIHPFLSTVKSNGWEWVFFLLAMSSSLSTWSITIIVRERSQQYEKSLVNRKGHEELTSHMEAMKCGKHLTSSRELMLCPPLQEERK